MGQIATIVIQARKEDSLAWCLRKYKAQMPTLNSDYNPPVPAFSVRAAQVRAGEGTVAV